MSENIIFFTCVTGNYLDPAIVWLSSFQSMVKKHPINSVFKPRVYLQNGLDGSALASLGAEVYYRELELITHPSGFGEERTLGMVARLDIIDELAAEGVEYAVYMDVDTLIVGSLAELEDIVLTETSPIAAVCELPSETNPLHPDSFLPADFFEYLGTISPNYFNSGVMVINPVAIKALAVELSSEGVLDHYVKNGAGLLFPDQDLLNKLVQEPVLLDDKFNRRPRAIKRGVPLAVYDATREELRQGAAVLHYIADTKPWSTTLDPTYELSLISLPFLDYMKEANKIRDRLSAGFYSAVENNFNALSSLWRR